MSNYDQWRDTHSFSRGAIDTDSAGEGLLWLFVAVALLGVLVLAGSLGGGSTAVDDRGEAVATSATGAEATGTAGD